MLLKHPWLSSLSKPETITEEDEEEEEGGEGETSTDSSNDVTKAVSKLDLGASGTEDPEVAEWVRSMLQGRNGKESDAKDGGGATKGRPALHAVPLDSVSPLGSPAITSDTV